MDLEQPGWQPAPPPHPGYSQQPPPAIAEPDRPRRGWRRPFGLRWKHILLALLALFMLLVAWLAVTAPLSKSLQPIAPPSLTLLSAEGEPIARRGAEIRAPVTIAELPKYVPAAFVSIEDRGFYHHWGISIRGIGRAAWRNMGAGGVREGGSTITQQLAKISFLNARRTAGRKAQEVLIAFWLEAWLKKDEILQRYLSNVYFGDNVYGLRAAAWHYFSHGPEHLTIPEAAMLAGMVKAPTKLAPTHDLDAAQERAQVVIETMVRDGAISREKAESLRPARVHLEQTQALPSGTYFADWVLPTARTQEGETYGDRKVQTTLEAPLQRLALQTIHRAGLGKAQVALVAMRPDGRVVAMVGGKDYSKSPFNRATQARRQPGSTFKLFVYLAALRSGMTPDSTIEDRPLKIGGWSPKNSGGHYRGTLTLRDAFARSSNVAAVRLEEKIGRRNVIRAARDLGVTSPLSDNPSLALGTSGVTLLEMTSAYAAVASGAYPVRPRGLDEGGKSWWERMWTRYAGSTRDSAFDAMKSLLSSVVTDGTGRGAALEIPSFGKTGTSQDNRDALFIGFAGDLIVGVWVGNDDNSPLGLVAGGGLPARIWRNFTAAALGTSPARIEAPPATEPPPEATGNLSFEVPLGDSGVRLGVDVNENGLSIQAHDESNRRDHDQPPARDPASTPLAPPDGDESGRDGGG
jgi:penicillin-binding protein 1A